MGEEIEVGKGREEREELGVCVTCSGVAEEVPEV